MISTEELSKLFETAKTNPIAFLESLLIETKAQKLESEKKLWALISEKFDDLQEAISDRWKFSAFLLKLRNFVLLEKHLPEMQANWDKLFRITPCHRYAAEGDLKALKEEASKVLNEKTQLKATDLLCLTPLYDAICQNHLDIIEFYQNELLCSPDSLVEQFVFTTTKNEGGVEEDAWEIMQQSLLHSLSVLTDYSTLEKIKLKFKLNLMISNNEGYWPIHTAIQEGNLAAIPLLYDPKMQEIPNQHGNFLIHEAIILKMEKCIPMIECLIKLGENVNQISEIGHTPLSTCFTHTFSHEQSPLESFEKRTAIATQLLGWGSDINQMTSYGVSFLIYRIPGIMNRFSYLDPFTNQWNSIENVPYTVEYPNNRRTGLPENIRSGLMDMAPQNSPRVIFDGDIPEWLKNVMGACLLSQTYFKEQEKIRFDTSSLLHLMVKFFPKNPRTEQEKLEVTYKLKVILFLIKSGINLDAIDNNGHTALSQAESMKLPGVLHILRPTFEAWYKKREEIVHESLDPKIGTMTPLVMQYLGMKHRDKNLEDDKLNDSVNANYKQGK